VAARAEANAHAVRLRPSAFPRRAPTGERRGRPLPPLRESPVQLPAPSHVAPGMPWPRRDVAVRKGLPRRARPRRVGAGELCARLLAGSGRKGRGPRAPCEAPTLGVPAPDARRRASGPTTRSRRPSYSVVKPQCHLLPPRGTRPLPRHATPGGWHVACRFSTGTSGEGVAGPPGRSTRSRDLYATVLRNPVRTGSLLRSHPLPPHLSPLPRASPIG